MAASMRMLYAARGPAARVIGAAIRAGAGILVIHAVEYPQGDQTAVV
jgi:hypothetical protein